MTRRLPPKQPKAKADAAALEDSIARRIATLKAALGDPFSEDRRLAHYATTLADADQALAHKRASPPRMDFLARADAFLAAHEIALSVSTRRSARASWEDICNRAEALFDVESIHRGHVRTLAALKYLETAFFTVWNESPPAKTRAFWSAVARSGLPYQRRDLIAEIFARGRISSREHYEHAVDIIGAAEDEKLLEARQIILLSRMIDAYESR